jgi:NAD(P)-dependent dehydrogenase (short-subunit alcohol dehydrogenase family)
MAVDDMRKAYFDGPGRASIIQRWATTDEIAAQVAFLCSPLAAAVNGAAQRVDGGIIRSLF